MKELETEFIGRGETRGFMFTQVVATGKGYVYKVQQSRTSKPYYEAFKRKENTRFKCVSYPSAKAFGTWAIWTYDIELAKEYIGANG